MMIDLMIDPKKFFLANMRKAESKETRFNSNQLPISERHRLMTKDESRLLINELSPDIINIKRRHFIKTTHLILFIFNIFSLHLELFFQFRESIFRTIFMKNHHK